MRNFILSRVGAMIVILIALIAVMFVLQHISPMDPVKAQLGANASAEAVAARRHTLGLDQPLVNQFWNYLTGAVHGNLGTSFRTRHPVSSDLGDFFPATLELAMYGLGLALILAGLLAFGTTLKWPGAGVLRAVLFTGAAAPMFLLGILGLIVFYQKLGWVPANGRISVPNPPTGPTGMLTVDGLLAGRLDVVTDALHHLILPAVVIALGPAVAIGRVLRSSLLTDADSDYARTARAKGLSEGRIMVGLDVFAVEPLAADSGFRGLPNVTLTPHLAGPTTERLAQLCDELGITLVAADSPNAFLDDTPAAQLIR